MLRIRTNGGKCSYSKEMKVEPGDFSFDMERVIKLVKGVTLEGGIPQKKVDRMISLIRDIEKLKDIKVLIGLLAKCP